MQADAVLISEIHPLSEQDTSRTEDKSVRHPRATFFLSILLVERCLEASVRRLDFAVASRAGWPVGTN